MGNRQTESLTNVRISVFVLSVLLLFSFVPSLTGKTGSSLNQSPLPEAYASAGPIGIAGLSNPTNVKMTSIPNDPRIFVVWEDDGLSGKSDIFISKSVDDGATFGEAVNVSNSTSFSTNPSVTYTSSGFVYVAWEESQDGSASDIWYASTDKSLIGISPFVPVPLTTTATASNPFVAASPLDEVYFVWEDSSVGNGDIFFAGPLGSISIINVSQSDGTSSEPVMAVSEDLIIYVAYQDDGTLDGNFDIFLSAAFVFDLNFTSPQNISESATDSTDPWLATHGSQDVYVVWQEVDNGNTSISLVASHDADTELTFSSASLLNVTETSSNPTILTSLAGVVFASWEDSGEILLSFSSDGGATFENPVNLSQSSSTASTIPSLSISSGGNPHVAWLEDTGTGTNTIFISADTDVIIESININIVNPVAPSWDLDSVTVSGTTTGALSTDSVLVDWGDGSSTSVSVETDGGWIAGHTYGLSSVGIREIIASLIDSSNALKVASEPSTVDVKKHATSLLLFPIPSVKEGSDIVVTGRLVDTDASSASSDEVGIANATISFSGSGSNNLGDALTGIDGAFSVIGLAEVPAPEVWAVQAHFAEASGYLGSSSDVEVYDTAATNSTEVDVLAGTQFVVIPDFDASIDFVDGNTVTSDGKIFVSECTAPNSPRYVAIEGRCLWISPGVKLADGYKARVEISFSNFTLPEGFAPEDIDLFHQEQSEDIIIDITDSRDILGESINGTTSSFGIFLLGSAIHSDQLAGSVRAELLVDTVISNNENFVEMRDISDTSAGNVTISLDQESYGMTDTPVITVNDQEGNLDPERIDSVVVVVVSSTSSTNSPNGILLSLQETGMNSGVFSGEFAFTIGTSSGSLLQANIDDELSIYYTKGVRIKVEFNGVVEAGIAQLSDTLITEEIPVFIQVGGAATTQLVDAQLLPGANVTATMSYANAPLNDVSESALRLWYKPSGGDWSEVTKRSGGSIVGVDEVAKTVTGEISGDLLGQSGTFTIGYVVGGGGGSGGGLARPGTGLVLDFVASLVSTSNDSDSPSSSSSSGGRSSNRAATSTTTVSDGSDITVSAKTPSGNTIVITFDNVKSSGVVSVTERPAIYFANLFDSYSASKGRSSVEGSQFTTVGSVFELDDSNIAFDGTVKVTLPYEDVDISSESNVRLIHLGENGWEDTTIAIDEDSNTVTGEMKEFSPVVVAEFPDGTYGPAYFELHPLSRLQVNNITISSPSGSDSSESTDMKSDPIVGDRATILVEVKNNQRVDQSAVVIVQLIDENGFTRSLTWQEVVVERGKTIAVSEDWESPLDMDYTVSVFVWTGVPRVGVDALVPEPLSFVSLREMTAS